MKPFEFLEKMDEKKENMIEIKEISRFEGNSIILGLPDVGLVGSIASAHLIDQLKLKEIAEINSDIFPPIVVVHKHRPMSPIRIYANNEIGVVISEVPISPDMINPLMESLTEWFKSNKLELVISIGGIPHPNRLEIDKPKVYGVSTSKRLDGVLRKNKIEMFEDGLIVGPSGIMLKKCMEKGINAVYLMAESHYKYPDPGAAASIINAISKILKMKIDVKLLLEKAEEIRITARDLMKRTEDVMKKMEKMHEKEIPMMYR